ncbi:MAG: ATP-binding protein [Candidatus Delongbacteria bacterium]|nr:ATP-binding protein [Candidatus Delongbacteria bacterium]
MKRYFESYLEEWKSRTSRKPLIVRGARQIGKTYTVEEFGRTNFERVIKINFEEKPEFKSFFNTNEVDEILLNINAYFNYKIEPGRTLLFLDEIQQCPQAITTLRYFYEKIPGLHVIAAGSLLDHVLNDKKYSMPVGRIEFAYMHPLNFYEFLIALGEEGLVSYIENYKPDKAVSPPIHEKLLKYVRLYYFIGGMPEAVREYSLNADIVTVERIHESILRTLEYDFSKYGTRSQQETLVTVMRYIPAGLGRKVKYSNIDQSSRSDVIKTAIRLLMFSRIVHIIYHTKAAGIPLEQGKDTKIYKPLFFDIGLANHILKLRLTDIDNLITINEGGLAEQFVGQQMLSSEPFFLDPQLYYWTREARNSAAELDFLAEANNTIIPVEVKAGKTGTLKSLQVFIEEKKNKIALRLNADQPSVTLFSSGCRLISLPLYLAGEWRRLID